MSKQKQISPKVTYSFIGLIGVLTLVLGFISLGRVIQNPAKQTQIARLKALQQASISSYADSDEALKNQDTDGDSLSDFDELYIYGTSPYLPDSDSDGLTDAQELESGNDPNCPTGQNCRTNRLQAPDNQAQLLESFGLEEFSDLLEINQIESDQPTETDLTSLTTNQIRELLLESGEITQEQLDQIDDELLIESYKEVISGNNNQ